LLFVVLIVLVITFAVVRHRRARAQVQTTTTAMSNVLGLRPADAPRYARYPRGRRPHRRGKRARF